MAKGIRDKIRLNSSAGTGHFYTTTKNKRTMPEKMEIKKFIADYSKQDLSLIMTIVKLIQNIQYQLVMTQIIFQFSVTRSVFSVLSFVISVPKHFTKRCKRLVHGKV